MSGSPARAMGDTTARTSRVWPSMSGSPARAMGDPSGGVVMLALSLVRLARARDGRPLAGCTGRQRAYPVPPCAWSASTDGFSLAVHRRRGEGDNPPRKPRATARCRVSRRIAVQEVIRLRLQARPKNNHRATHRTIESAKTRILMHFSGVQAFLTLERRKPLNSLEFNGFHWLRE